MPDDIEKRELARYRADGGKGDVTFDINSNSIVWEIGYFKGVWVRKIVSLYDPHITVFEPVRKWFLEGRSQLEKNPKVKFLNHGLGDRTRLEKFKVNTDDTGLFSKEGQEETVLIRDIREVVIKEQHIDLMEVNCEGGEYEILPALIQSGLIQQVRLVAIQFHDVEESSISKRESIRQALSKTHKEILCYHWIYEVWERISNA